MALPTLQFLAGLLLLIYLLSFVLFAFIRIATGVSIQRLGLRGLRRIAFTPKDGLRIEIRGLGFTLHRPTFAQPTVVSIVLHELKVTVDLKALGEKPRKKTGWTHWANGTTQKGTSGQSTPVPVAGNDDETGDDDETQRSLTWKRLTDAKDKIKRLHRNINWLRQVDVIAHATTLVVVDVGSVQVGGLNLAVDTRRKTVDRSRLFNHHKPKLDQEQWPAEWLFSARSIFFTPEGKESTELLDHCTLNVHGFLKKGLEGLRDASIALKLGRLSIPYDDVKLCMERAQKCRTAGPRRRSRPSQIDVRLTDVMEEVDDPSSREENLVRTVSDSREFASSILRGIHEFQFAVGFLGLTKQIDTGHKTDPPVFLNVSMKEVGMDLLRLDPRSPAHLMYFSPGDIAHQALLAAISISVGIDNSHGHPERLLYIPMATTTLNTTLPSKTVHFTNDKDTAERNTNILFANLVVTSPSLDLDPKHLPLLLAMLHNRDPHRKPPDVKHRKRYLFRRLLPKANIKISVHEPVIRVTLPPMDLNKRDSEEFDLLISSSSSMSLDMESSHAASGELHYALSSTFRMNTQQLYYQTAAIEKHDLLLTDYLELKVQVSASPDIVVEVWGTAQTFSLYMVRPEISEGLRQIVTQMQKDVSRRKNAQKKHDLNVLRRLPTWMAYVHLQGSDFNVEVAGVDPAVSKHSRGVALHLESWTAEYKRSRGNEMDLKPIRRRAPSRTINRDEHFLRSPTGSPKSPKRTSGNPTDGRRLAVHFHGLEGIVIEEDNQSEQEPTLSLPRMEIALQTLSDKQGPIFHVHAYSQSLFLRYSLYRHFALCMAVQVLQRSFDWGASKTTAEPKPMHSPSNLSVPTLSDDLIDPISGITREIVTVDIKTQFVQIKADMPADPPLMLQIYGMEAGKHRWTSPFLRSRLVRLLAENPAIKRAWSRIVSVKSLRLDYRQSKLRYGHTVTDERSFDIATDAIRIAVPHQLVMHKIFDNVSNVAKTVKQVHHRFKTGTDEYVLEKEAEGPKLVPKISLRSRAVLFELEDNAFEWKLGTIYRIGLMEQKQRLAREQAFELKVRKLQQQDEQRGNSRYRARSAHDVRSRGKLKKEKELRFHRRSKSADSSGDDSSPDRGRSDHPMRYNKDGFSGLSGSHQTSIKDARVKLNRLNAETWRKRIDFAMKTQNRTMSDIRSTFWGLDELPDDVEQRETILAVSQRPALMTLAVSDLEIIIDKPSFPISEYPRFLHRVGKGMPFDTQYSLLIPMHVQIQMGEAKIQLRDYPLPLLHFPAIGSIQSSRLPSVLMKTDFVIAEEFRDLESSRVSRVVVVPPEYTAEGELTGGYAVDVRRTVAPVKTYSDMAIDINSAYPTRITWGTSYQPAIQDMMQIIENFTKPAVDPSERVGFWDKIRLTFHSRINVSWKGDGDVHLILKGSRDPYMVTGHGAGFVMCWQNDVQLSLAEDEDPRNFMIVRSGSYVLAIPDLNHYARHEVQEVENVARPDTSSSVSSHRQRAVFKKTVMKLNGNVKWVAGLVFERNLDDGERSFNFIPHYQVTLKNPKYAKASNGKEYDAFRGFRSHHIHMSIAIAAPHEREWSLANLEPSKTYNSVHLTPRFFTHFFSWWSMFSGAMSLPVRQGKLWPGVEKSSKKFGRHLATIKYNLLLSPLYMSHIYKHKDAEDYGTGVVSATGLKARLDSLMFDLHQRREEFRTLVQAPESQQNSRQNKTTGMRINQVQLDLIRTDIRAVSASLMGTGSDEVDNATMEDLASYNQEYLTADLSKFTIPDNDLGWVDMDDFIELGWILPSRRHPETQILPLAFTPRFTYFRQTDHCNNISGDKHRKSAFGNEPTHHCVISARNDPRRVQCHLIEQRIERVKEQVAHNQRAIDQQELKVVRETSEGQEESQRRLETLRNHTNFLQRKLEFLSAMHTSLLERLESTSSGRKAPDPETDGEDEYFEADEDQDVENPNGKDTNTATNPTADLTNEFNNRFIIHNIHLKWGNSLRNIILRYIHQVSQRRGFVYYMSRRAVKFILDVVEEQNKSRRPSTAGPEDTPMAGDDEAGLSIDETIDQLLRDGKNFVNADEEDAKSNAEAGESGDTGDSSQPTPTKADEEVADDYLSQNSYLVRLIAPQIQLQSEKDTKSAVLVTAKGMQLKVLSIMDKDRVMDEVSGLVQRRFIALMDSLQIFVTNSKTFSSTDDIHMYSGSSYGSHPGTAWPPWVPFEVMFEFHTNPFGFQRVVQRTSASMRYDKYNALRLKYNDDVSAADNATSTDNKESRIDHLWVDFPHVRALCDSRQYYAMYVIVLDLLLYHEPLEKTRNERLEKIMLASDFTDLAGAPKLVMGLQERIQQLEEIKTVFQINEKYLDKQGWEDRIEVEKDLAVYEDELFFVMKAITTAQRKQDDRAQAKESTGLLRIFVSASDIVWHLLREGAESLAEFQLKNVTFDRTDNNDGSNSNAMEIEQVRGLNLLPNALYPEMISPFLENDQTLPENAKCLKVYFVALESIAGIPVVEHFEVELYPLKVQLEYQIGKKLLQYIFPTYGDNKTANASPFLLKHSLPGQDGDDGDDFAMASGAATSMSSSMSTEDGTTEALKQRLTPTLQLPDPAQKTEKRKALTKRPSAHYFRFFRDNPSRSGTELRRTLHPSSALAGPNGPSSSTQSSRPSSIRSNTTTSSQTANESERTAKRFALYRTGTGLTVKGPSKKDARSDDLTEMMSRASEYMTVAYFKVPSMVLCLSYKGKSSRNFEDVHDLVFRMPTIEYRNKTWSNLDLVNQLKKDVLRALLSHAGTIVGNKISNHRPSAKAQSRLRQLANSSAMLNTSPDLSGTESNNIHEYSPGGSDISGEDRAPRRSFTSGRQPSLISTVSEEGSSLHSSNPPSTYDRARSTHGSIMGGYNSHNHSGLGLDDVEDGRAFADELSRVDNTEPVHANLIHSLSKHLTGVGAPFTGHIRGRAGSGAASTRAASVATGISGMSGVSGREGSVMDDEGGDGSGDGPKMQKAKMLGKKLLGRGN